MTRKLPAPLVTRLLEHAAFMRRCWPNEPEIADDIQAAAAALASPSLAGRARNVVIHADGRLTCELEIADGQAGARFLEQIGGRR